MHEVIRHFLVTGKVQGVAFRHNARREATRLGVRGWARNLPDGTVEVWARGNADAVDTLLHWLRRGPAHARVDAVREQPAGAAGDPDSPEIPAGFEVF